MTPEQEQALLNKVAQLERRLEEREEQQDAWIVNGANDLLGGYGFQQIGRDFRFQKGGLQILAPTYEMMALVWLPKFLTNFDEDTDYPYVRLYGRTDPLNDAFGTSGVFESARDDDHTVRLEINTSDPGRAVGTLSANGAAGNALLSVVSDNDTLAIICDETPIQVGVLTSDPALLGDGMIWYRSDTDKFRGRADGSTETFAMEGWVTQNFVPAGFVVLGFNGGGAISGGTMPAPYESLAQVDTEAGDPTDDLDTIDTTDVLPGTMLVLRPANASRVVTVKHGTGNIFLDGGQDFVLDSERDKLTLVYDHAIGEWHELSRSDNG